MVRLPQPRPRFLSTAVPALPLEMCNAQQCVRLLPLTPTKFVLASDQAGECSRQLPRVLKKLLISS